MDSLLQSVIVTIADTNIATVISSHCDGFSTSEWYTVFNPIHCIQYLPHIVTDRCRCVYYRSTYRDSVPQTKWDPIHLTDGSTIQCPIDDPIGRTNIGTIDCTECVGLRYSNHTTINASFS